MSKKSLLLSSSLLAAALITQSAQAHFNVGLKGGYQQGFNKTNSNYSQSTLVPPGTGHANSNELASRGALGGVILGWGMPIANDKFFVGLEAGFDISSTKGKESRTIDAPAGGGLLKNDLELKRTYGFDVSAKFGAYIESVLAYLKLGVGYSKYKFKSHVFTVGSPLVVDTTQTMNKNFVSFKPAIGFEVPVSDCLCVGLEYSHEFNKKKSFTQNVPIAGAAATTVSHSVKPQTGTVAVTVNYKFGQGVA